MKKLETANLILIYGGSMGGCAATVVLGAAGGAYSGAEIGSIFGPLGTLAGIAIGSFLGGLAAGTAKTCDNL